MNEINIGGSEKDWETYKIISSLEQTEKDMYKLLSKDINDDKKKQLSKQHNVYEKSVKHLNDSKMSYSYHFWHSVKNGNKLLWLALSSYTHAIIPGKLKQHAARGIISLYEDMKKWPHLRRAMYEISQQKKLKS